MYTHAKLQLLSPKRLSGKPLKDTWRSYTLLVYYGTQKTAPSVNKNLYGVNIYHGPDCAIT